MTINRRTLDRSFISSGSASLTLKTGSWVVFKWPLPTPSLRVYLLGTETDNLKNCIVSYRNQRATVRVSGID